jgi:hypothetical protein
VADPERLSTALFNCRPRTTYLLTVGAVCEDPAQAPISSNGLAQTDGSVSTSVWRAIIANRRTFPVGTGYE